MNRYLNIILLIFLFTNCKNNLERNRRTESLVPDSIVSKGLQKYYLTSLWELSAMYFDQSAQCVNKKTLKKKPINYSELHPELVKLLNIGDSLLFFSFYLKANDTFYVDCYKSYKEGLISCNSYITILFRKSNSDSLLDISCDIGWNPLEPYYSFEGEFKMFCLGYFANKYVEQHQFDSTYLTYKTLYKDFPVVDDTLISFLERGVGKKVKENWQNRKEFIKDSLYNNWKVDRESKINLLQKRKNEFYIYLRENKDSLDPWLKDMAINKGVIKE